MGCLAKINIVGKRSVTKTMSALTEPEFVNECKAKLLKHPRSLPMPKWRKLSNTSLKANMNYRGQGYQLANANTGPETFKFHSSLARLSCISATFVQDLHSAFFPRHPCACLHLCLCFSAKQANLGRVRLCSQRPHIFGGSGWQPTTL